MVLKAAEGSGEAAAEWIIAMFLYYGANSLRWRRVLTCTQFCRVSVRECWVSVVPAQPLRNLRNVE